MLLDIIMHFSIICFKNSISNSIIQSIYIGLRKNIPSFIK